MSLKQWYRIKPTEYGWELQKRDCCGYGTIKIYRPLRNWTKKEIWERFSYQEKLIRKDKSNKK